MRTTKQRILYNSLIAILLLPSASCALKIEDADFGNILTSSASILHPIFGLALYVRGQKMLINLYEHGNPEHPLIKIIRTLFHHDTDNEILRPSGAEASVAYGFGPYEVGWLLALIVCRPELFSDPNLYKPETNGKKIKIDKELDLFIRAVDQTHKKRVLTEHPNRKKGDLRGTSVKKILDFSSNTIKALQLSTTQLYDPEFVPLILNAFVCAKSRNKKDIYDFVVNGFIQHSGEQEKKTDYLTPHGLKIIGEKRQKEEFLNKKNPLNNIQKIVEAYFATLTIDTKLPASLLIPGTTYLFSLKPQITPICPQHITKYNNAPDCAEAALLHLVTDILFNHQSRHFDMTTLPQKLQNKQPLMFAFDLVNGGNLNDIELRTTWFEFLSKRPKVAYKQTTSHSVSARAKNIFILLNQIFSVNTTSWRDLGRALSSPQAHIVFKGPDLNSEEPLESVICFHKRYEDDSTFNSIIGISFDSHAAIGRSEFKQKAKKSQQKNALFADRLVPLGLPPAVYAAIVPLNKYEWSKKVFPKKFLDAKKLFLTLSKDLKDKSFFEFTQLTSCHPEIKTLINPTKITPGSTIRLKERNTWWLLTSKSYTNPLYWEAIVNSPKSFINQAFFYENYDAIDYVLDIVLHAMTEPGSPDEMQLLRTVWYALMSQYKNRRPKMDLPKAAITYRNRPDRLEKILKKLIRLEPTILPHNIKNIIIQDIQTYGPLAQKLVQYDNDKSSNGTIFTYLKPHLLYTVFEHAVSDPSETIRKACLNFLLKDPRYLEATVYQQHTIPSLSEQENSGIVMVHTLSDIKRAGTVRNTLIKNYKKEQEEARKWAVVPYMQK